MTKSAARPTAQFGLWFGWNTRYPLTVTILNTANICGCPVIWAKCRAIQAVLLPVPSVAELMDAGRTRRPTTCSCVSGASIHSAIARRALPLIYYVRS